MNSMSNKCIVTAILLLATFGCSTANNKPQYFSSPDDALQALEGAVAMRGKDRAEQLFGSDGDYLIHSGDPVIDKARGDKFVELFNQAHRLKPLEDGSYILLLGKKEWPFPVPLVSEKQGWYFDAEMGREAILDRFIGQNELSALKTARTIYLAQRHYASADRDGDGIKEYASHIISSPGKRDGLYWSVEDGETLSPLGPGIAKAADENYTIGSAGEPQPYKGYLHKLYTSPSSGSNEGDVFSRPGSYWLISYPAAWNSTGVMTFASNERGWIFEKNLQGDDSILKAKSVVIDQSWKRIE